MTRGTRIVAVDAGEAIATPVEELIETVEVAEVTESDWSENMPGPTRKPWLAIVAMVVSLALVFGWSAAFALSNWEDMSTGGSLSQWINWVRDWSVPVLLIAVLWLLGLRNSRREAQRFGETARLLSHEASALEERLTTVNRELSLAREFLASQTRDLETLGRLATDRLSENADKLAGLIKDNGSRVDAIGDVSTAALENMEKLRGQLPVIASSAKDVTNNIATAGRTAHAQIEELINGFKRLNEFGQASEAQVHALSATVQTSLAEFTRQTDQLETTARERFAALEASGAEFRTKLDGHEVEALAAIRTRANVLAEELDAARSRLDGDEAESLTSLRARLSAVRDESSTMARIVREAEERAIAAWKGSIERLEADLRSAIHQVGEIDEKAMDSARKRLAALADEAREVDERMSERDRLFETELGRRRSDFEQRHEQFIARLDEQMAALDSRLTARREAQEQHLAGVSASSESLAGKLSEFAAQMQEAVAQGQEGEIRLAASLGVLAEKLAVSREALAGTDAAVASLTDGSVRLLELIQASVEHSTVNLPAAIAAGEARLAAAEERASGLKARVGEAETQGAALAEHVSEIGRNLTSSLERVEALHLAITGHSASDREALTAMQASLETVRNESLALAQTAQEELRKSIAELEGSARDAVAGIEQMSAAGIAALAVRIGEESGQAIEAAMRSRAAEAAGQLEQATAKAAAISRDAAIQLRDQLVKVNELTGHLERRVAYARSRAEEQVDNDFARRVALITESLNSNAIDIAKAMDAEVSDTAWAQYLKGDRGIFARRAVKLLDTPSAKAVMQLYESDRTFRDHVSRYVHDFEAMLRQLLSTRDGHALGVTILSSDMGKLYVALAQSIERLRS
jgi:hypothetical protein